MTDDEQFFARLKEAASRDAPPPDLRARVLDTVTYRRRLEDPLPSRRDRAGVFMLATGLVALAAATTLWLKTYGNPLRPHIAAEPGGSARPVSLPSHSASPPAVVDPCKSRVVASGSAPLVDDFEDGDDTISPLDGRGGFWRWARESDAPGTAPALLPVPRPESRPRNRLALHAKGGELIDWGATVEVNFRPTCYDASSYGGISVQARGPGRIFLSMREVGAVPPSEGGSCLRDCYNSHAVKLELGSEWRTYRVTWNELRQRGIGKPPLDPTRLHSIAFLIHPEDTPYDVWLDDVRFLPKAASESARENK